MAMNNCNNHKTKSSYLEIAQQVLNEEAEALILASKKLSEEAYKNAINNLVDIFKMLTNSNGSLIFCGVGKSGIVANKLAATFSSLGLSSWFLHPVEALHGDLGRVNKNDAIIFISKSGSSEEILKLIPFLPINENFRIGLLGNINSLIAKKCAIVFDCSVAKEACLNNQAPTTSSTLAMSMGDALAVIFEKFIGLSKESFAENHPGGHLGKILRFSVKDLMWDKSRCPILKKDDSLKDVLLQMTKFNVGGAAIINESERLEGIIVEGDIRRAFLKENSSLEMKASEIMMRSPTTIRASAKAYEALNLMEQKSRQIYVLPVLNDEDIFVGFIRLHDLVQ